MSKSIEPPAAAVSSGQGGEAATKGGAAESAKTTRQPDRIEQALSPKARAAYKQRQANNASKQSATTSTGASAAATQVLEPPPAAAAQAAAGEAKPGDEEKGKTSTGAAAAAEGVIDLSEPGAEPPVNGEDALEKLTPEQMADAELTRKKYLETHQDNAKLRKQRREAQEENARLKEQLAQREKAEPEGDNTPTKAQPPSYLDRMKSRDEVDAARADAVETLRQLQANPEADHVLLPGGRKWAMINDKGEHQGAAAAELMLGVLDGYEAKVKTLGEREASDKLVAEKLPVLKKAIPDFEKSYQDLLGSDWGTRAPELSLHAAIGKLVTEGKYVLTPKTKAAPKVETAPAQREADLPNNPPAVRKLAEGEVDLAPLRAAAFKGDQKALKEWIKKSGRAA